MDVFTLTWSTSTCEKESSKYNSPIHIYTGDREAIWRLWYLLQKEIKDYRFVTVRDAMGKKVDMTKSMAEMPIYNVSCFL